MLSSQKCRKDRLLSRWNQKSELTERFYRQAPNVLVEQQQY